MKHIIVGTAGHIDHGKTTLIRTLTGRNTDRWEEEQKRGITIDLGFTYFDLPGGNRVGIIDVPGHEKFINNMLAGVIGMDLVMLVIAADEGVMPQTREHMDILGLAGIKKSIIVLNKCDLVDEDWLELVKDDIREELKGSFLEEAPMIEVSAATGDGIPGLVELIDRMTGEDVEEKDIYTIPRLPIDRVFSLSGFGTVITGTLISGQIKKEDQLEIYPLGRACKIRSIQVHGEDQSCCYAGQRVALNLSNVKKSEVKRGCVLAPIDSMKNTMMLDVSLNILPSSLRVLENRARLHLFTGTGEVLCRAVLLNVDSAGPGDRCYAQLRLEDEIAVRRGDRFIVRFYSPMETIGGGVILEPNPTKKKRFDENAVKELEIKEEGSHTDVIEMHIREHSETMITVSELAKLTAMSADEVMEQAVSLEEEQAITVYRMKKDVYLWHKSAKRNIEEKMTAFIGEFQENNPYKYGAKKSELRTRFLNKIKQNVFDEVIQSMEGRDIVKREGEYISLPDFQIPEDECFERIRRGIIKPLEMAGFDFVRFSELPFEEKDRPYVEDILQILTDQKKVVKIADDLYTTVAVAAEGRKKVEDKLAADGIITIAELRDLLNTSRKSSKPFLEYLDSIKVTKKNGTESERISYS